MKDITGVDLEEVGFVLRRDKGAPLTHDEMDNRIAGIVDLLVFMQTAGPGARDPRDVVEYYTAIQATVQAPSDGQAVDVPVTGLGYFGVEVNGATMDGKSVACEGYRPDPGVVIDPHGRIIDTNFTAGSSTFSISDNPRFVIFRVTDAEAPRTMQVSIVQPQAAQEG